MMINEYMHILLNLFAVLSLIFITLFVLKKIKSNRYSANKYINIIQVVPVGAKERVILLEANNVFLLVGATPNHITVLHSFDPTTFPKDPLPALSKNGFADIMQRVYDKKKGVVKSNERDALLDEVEP